MGKKMEAMQQDFHREKVEVERHLWHVVEELKSSELRVSDLQTQFSAAQNHRKEQETARRNVQQEAEEARQSQQSTRRWMSSA